jgi:hypothetical protein
MSNTLLWFRYLASLKERLVSKIKIYHAFKQRTIVWHPFVQSTSVNKDLIPSWAYLLDFEEGGLLAHVWSVAFHKGVDALLERQLKKSPCSLWQMECLLINRQFWTTVCFWFCCNNAPTYTCFNCDAGLTSTMLDLSINERWHQVPLNKLSTCKLFSRRKFQLWGHRSLA